MSCRLYPLGRQIQNEEVQYIFQGKEFPCLDGCPDVTTLPHLSVGEYLKGQSTDKFELAQDEYLLVMQNMADIAFELLLDTGLAVSGDKATLPLWRKMGNELPEALADRIGQDWIDSLMLPAISDELENPIAFARKHKELFRLKAQEKFGKLHTHEEFHQASVLIMGVALHLARGIGASPAALAEHWINTARSHGAQE